jgi:AcrR family transcriptional regulator
MLSAPVPRPLNPAVDQAIANATRELLAEKGFGALSMEEIAKRAGVGKPAIYRRYRDKVELVERTISRQLPRIDPPDVNDTRAELQRAVEQGLPADGPSCVGLIGGLIAEQERHPELIEAFRKSILLPRRATVRTIIERGQARGDIRRDLDPEHAIDLMAGSFLARVFAGLDTGTGWRAAAFNDWWEILRERTGT